MKTREIILKEKFAHNISTRAAIENIFNFSTNYLELVIIDFSEINFISSSAAHQIVIEMKALKKLSIELNFINTSDNVQRMINLAKTDRKNIFTTHEISVHYATNESDLEKLFL
ncbi:hypothetical protein ES705_17147 [subsurface metagenome]